MRANHHRGAAAPGLAAPPPAVDPAAALTASHKDEAPGWQAEGFRGQAEAVKHDSHGTLVLGQPASAAGPAMNSREIAELTGKRHDNVMADARKMLIELHGRDRLLSFQGTVERANPSGGAGIASPVYVLPKRETLILVSGYSVTMRARIIDRLAELERAAAPALPDFTDPAAAAIAWAEQFKAKQALQLQNATQAAALAIAAPKAAGLDRIATASEGSVGVRVAAQLANVPQGQFIAFLIERGWLHRKGGRGGLVGAADKLGAGLVEMKRVDVAGPNSTTRTVAQVFITQRGLARLAELIEREAPHLRCAKAVSTSHQGQLALPILPLGNQEGGAP